MGTLLVSALLGASAHLRQIRQANQKQAALESIDRLLNNWAFYQFSDKNLQDSANAANVPLINSTEPSSLRNASNFALRLSLQPQSVSAGYEIEVVRVEAISQAKNNQGKVLTWVEIARPRLKKQVGLSPRAAP